MSKVLIADDDLDLADVLSFTLRRAGFEVLLAHNGVDALRIFRSERPDLVILDWTMPQQNGLQVCKLIRLESTAPILMLTVRNSDDDVVAALEAGADEYVTKPFSPRQLAARVRSLLRRTSGEVTETLACEPFTLDPERHELLWEGNPPLHLTNLEYRLMLALMQNAGHVLSTESLITRVWGQESATSEMLKQLVYRLRIKLQPESMEKSLIETVLGQGYILNLPK